MFCIVSLDELWVTCKFTAVTEITLCEVKHFLQDYFHTFFFINIALISFSFYIKEVNLKIKIKLINFRC